MIFLYHLHSGLRFLVLFAGALALGVLIWGMVAKRPYGRLPRLSATAFVGLLDLQVVVGLVLVFMGIWYPALMGHLMLMVLAAVAAHIFVVLARGSTEPGRAHRLALIGVVLTLALIAAGILAIRPGVFHVAPRPGHGVVQDVAPAPDDGL
jgi:heme A synthase